MCFYWRRTTQRAFSSLEFSHLQGKANSNIELAANVCIYAYACSSVYLPNIGQTGLELRGWQGFWENVIPPEGGKGRERSLLYKQISNLNSSNSFSLWWNTDLCGLAEYFKYSITQKECVICRVMSLSQFKCFFVGVLCNWVSVISQKQAYSPSN